MAGAEAELIVAVFDTQVLGVADINQSVVATPTSPS